MKNLLVRTLTGAVFIALIISSVLWSPWSFFALFCLMTFGAALEFFQLLCGKSFCGFGYFTAAIACAIFAVVSKIFLIPEFSFVVVFVFPLMLLLPMVLLFSRKAIESTHVIASGLMSILFVAIPFSAMTGIRVFGGNEEGKWLLLAFFFTIWCYDTFAYLTGWAFGKHRLYEAISPKKSWEGAIGGLLFALVCCYIFYRCIGVLSVWQWMGFGLIISVIGTLGDLTESLLKRALKVKDSGKILPGHGGLLDRFDSTIFAAPCILAYLYFLNYCI